MAYVLFPIIYCPQYFLSIKTFHCSSSKILPASDMELGLSLGDGTKPSGFSAESCSPRKSSKRTMDLDFCMDLRLGSPVDGSRMKRRKSDEETDDDEVDDADRGSEGDLGSDFNREGSEGAPPMQLSLLPLAPVPRRNSESIFSIPDNGSPENNGSPANSGPPAARGLDVNRLPASTNGVYGLFGNAVSGNLQICGENPNFEAAGNDVVEGEKTPSRASDDDENGPSSRKKLRLSKEQSAFLEESFKEHHTLNPKQKLALAKQLNLRPRQVEVWFQNRRARTKLKQTEVDCEYLKRCCETLTEENRRLHKELMELRALKASSSPFYAQLPATTLTMCPSCERVATADSAAKAVQLPPTKPGFYPFSHTPTTHPNRPAASS